MRKLLTRALLIALVASGGPVGVAMLRGDPVWGVAGGVAFAVLLFTAVVLLGRLAVAASAGAGWHRLARVLGREVGRSGPSDT